MFDDDVTHRRRRDSNALSAAVVAGRRCGTEALRPLFLVLLVVAVAVVALAVTPSTALHVRFAILRC